MPAMPIAMPSHCRAVIAPAPTVAMTAPREARPGEQREGRQNEPRVQRAPEQHEEHGRMLAGLADAEEDRTPEQDEAVGGDQEQKLRLADRSTGPGGCERTHVTDRIGLPASGMSHARGR